MSEKLPESINFAREEEKILALWEKLDVFQNCLRQSKGKPKYSFYDGPPFATGLPHYGHLLAGTIKDVVTRYAHQSGYHVERRFGWDTHGLPVEYEIDKALNIRGPEDVAKMGIARYNAECRKIVTRYATEWEKIVGRIGRWIDFKNDYKTLYPWYMESIWWVFGELYNKGLVYRGVKVMPYSTGCNTPLSNFEAGQNYKEVVDPSVVVAFPLTDEPGVFVLAWTTTPWTLPSNLALCCHPEFEYVEAQDAASGRLYIVLESSLGLVYKSADAYVVRGRRRGASLAGKSYEPPFPYFAHLRERGAFRILNDTYVTADSGTGVVHQAPYFGEDDYRCCLAAGIIARDQETVCPVDDCGRFTEPVSDFAGIYVKEADRGIVERLRASGRLVHSGTSKHSYPYCWRSDTPLIYKAVPSWFVRVEAIKEKLIAANSETYWVPDYVKEKRFGNWLRDARDWAVSRNRYWGNPLPLWVSEDGKEVVCVGSIAELEELTGVTITDLHRESIDHLTIPSRRPGHAPLRRVPEVFDCWFESGAMPYAQMHYPFERARDFEESFPADFIAEGIDQTRGWFYTLLVISTALFGRAPYKNLVANGLVLASDGQKMSKRKKNYPDPMEVVDKFGADALRLYLINSPVVRAENLRFKEEGVRDVIKDVFLPWYNAFRFLAQNVERYEREECAKFVYEDVREPAAVSGNVMDRWIVSFTQSLLLFVKREMRQYRLYTVVPRLVEYIDNLTNWYVRMNRRRIKGDSGAGECRAALNTLFSVLYAMARTNAPFTPFLAEFMFQRLSKLLPASRENLDSVHYQMIPEPCALLISERVERAVASMQTVVELGRVVRDRRTIPVKYPLPEIVVIHRDPAVLRDVESLKTYILEELNVRELTLTSDKQRYGVALRAEPEHRTLGARLKGEFKAVAQAIKELGDAELCAFVETREITVRGHRLDEEDLRLMFSFTGPRAAQLSERYEAHAQGSVLILLDVTPDETMRHEGVAREMINRVQKLRKKAQLVPSDEAVVYYDIGDAASSLARVALSHRQFIEATTRTPQRDIAEMPSAGADVILEETQTVKGVELRLVLVRGNAPPERRKPEAEPFYEYVNVELVDLEPRYGANGRSGTVLVRSAKSKVGIDYAQLRHEIDVIFGLYGRQYQLFANNSRIHEAIDTLSLHKRTVYVVGGGGELPACAGNRSSPVCRFVNVRCGADRGSVLLENPAGDFVLDAAALNQRLGALFGKPQPSANRFERPIEELNGFTVEIR